MAETTNTSVKRITATVQPILELPAPTPVNPVWEALAALLWLAFTVGLLSAIPAVIAAWRAVL